MRAGLMGRGFMALSLALSAGAWARPPEMAAAGTTRTLYLDPLLSKPTAKLLRADLRVLAQLPVSSTAGSWFSMLFGGYDAQAVFRFLDDRVNVFASDAIAIEDRLIVEKTQAMGPTLSALKAEGLWASNIALNLGTSLWLFQLRHSDSRIGVRVGAFRINPNSSRIGVIQISEAYNRNLSLISRLDTLVHEARHSDCTGGLQASDLERLRSGQLPTTTQCGHFHAICPPGHIFAGLPACDSHAWGAYSTGALYAANVVRGCKNCKERMIQEALVTSADSFSRLVAKDGRPFSEEMLVGILGFPDSRSSLGAAPSGDRPDFERIK